MGSGYKLRVMESIDSSDFYDMALTIDQFIQNNDSVEAIVYSILLRSGVATTQLGKWIKVNRLVLKQTKEEKAIASVLSSAVRAQPIKKAIIDSIEVITKIIVLTNNI